MTRTNVTALATSLDTGVAHHLCQVRYHGKRLLGLTGSSRLAAGESCLPADVLASLAALADALRALAALSPSLLNEAPAFAALVVPDVGRLDRVVACGVAKGDLCSLVDWAHRTLNLMPRPARRC